MDANTFAILVLLGSFFLMIFLRFPIAYAVALSSVFCLVAQGHNLTTICQQMVKGISSFSLMSLGPIPSIGEIAPCSTWYTPSYFPVFSYAARSLVFSTTMIVLWSRLSLLQIGQSS